MPRKDEHINWTTHDRGFWTSIDLDNTPFADWVVSGMFYESLHWVEAFLAFKGYHSGEHRERLRNMRFFKSELRPIQTDYNKLKQDSETARYDCYKHTAEEARQLIPLVNHIKGHISQLL
jgi:uncharacterized protein (UPF0332 family)